MRCKSSFHEASHPGAASAHTVPSSHSAPSCLFAVPPSSLPLLSHLLSPLDPSGFFHHPLCAFSHFATVFFICGPAASLLPHPPSCIPSCAPPVFTSFSSSSLSSNRVSHLGLLLLLVCLKQPEQIPDWFGGLSLSFTDASVYFLTRNM